MNRMDIEALRNQFVGRRFGELVLHHRKQTDLQTTVAALQGTIAELPTPAQPLVESWIDDMGTEVRSEAYWKKDCACVFTTITEAAERKLRSAGVDPTTDDVFNMFQIIVLNFAYSTHQHPQSKAFIQKALGVGFLGLIMRLTSALVITAVCAAWGSLAGYPYLWLPYTGVAASVIDLFSRDWVDSPEIGAWATASVMLKLILNLVGCYAMLAQFACVGLGIYWIVRA